MLNFKTNFLRINVCLLVIFVHFSFFHKTVARSLEDQDSPDDIEQALQFINEDSVAATISHLQDYGTRFMIVQNRFEISGWIYNAFREMGFTDVRYDSFYAATHIDYEGITIDTLTLQRNIVATIEGSIDPGQEIIVCGHYDSFNENDPFTFAPGADDNASGTAAVLEIARVIKSSGFVPEKTIRFIAFAAEELLLFGDGGSEHYAQSAFNNQDNIILVMNHDMIAHTLNPPENSFVNINRHPDSDIYSSLALDCIEKYTSLQGIPYPFWSSDLGSFNAKGYNGIYFEETDFSPFYHSADDIQDNYDMQYCTEVIRASATTLINMTIIPDQLKNMEIIDQPQINSALVKWSPALESDISHYKLHVTDENGVFNNVFTTEDTSWLVKGLSVNIYYDFKLVAVDHSGNDGLETNLSFIPVKFTHDSGVLIVDESTDGNGTLLNPTDEQVDLFYEELCSKFRVSQLDIAQDGITIKDIISYSTIIWHGNGNLEALQNFVPELKKFLNDGGNFIYTGEKPSIAFTGEHSYPADFTKGEFINDYLKIEHAENKFGSRFNGAVSVSEGYPTIYTDTSKTKIDLNYHLRNIESVYPSDQAKTLYLYNSAYDSATIQGAMNGQPVAIQYQGTYKAVVFTFPLYYMDHYSARTIMEKILTEEFAEITTISAQEKQTPESFVLYQNFPNPFNITTGIKFSLGKPGHVNIYIYDIYGRLINVLLDEHKSAGDYLIKWNGTAASGNTVASGVYFYRFSLEKSSETKKMILIK